MDKSCETCKHSRPDIWERFNMLIFRYGDTWAVCSRYPNGIKTLCCNERLDLEGRNGDKVDTCGSDAKYWEAQK